MSVDPAIEQRFAEILANTRAKAAGISDRVEARKREIAEESERMREQNERMCKELDEHSQARAEAKDDPAAKNEWLKRTPGRENTYQFGESEEPAYEPPPAAPPTIPDATERTDRTPAPRRGRHSRQDEFDDDDFSNNSWLD